MKITVLTLGCRTNQAESMHIEQALNYAGHQIVNLSENPDICIINTCTVTSKADYQSRQLIYRALKNNPKVFVTGCYAELNHERLKSIEGSIEIIKNTKKYNIINKIPQTISSDTGINPPHFSIPVNPRSFISSRSRAIVKVQDGCNYSCSYCAIPIARGRSRSIPINEVIERIKFYESLGYKEIVLTGIHLGTYGFDFKPKVSLSKLLEAILISSKTPRIRLSSLEINEIDEELLDLITDKRICKHLHVPLQSGDDSILRLMNRTYSVNEYCKGIERIISKVSDVAIGTDVIVGFPGEGEGEFNNTKNLIESIAFSYLHVFPYSQRPGTKASSFYGQINEKAKKQRSALLREVAAAKKRDYIIKHIGKTLDVIIENEGAAGLIGTTGNYIKVLLSGENSNHTGMLVSVRILDYKDSMATGIVEKNLQPFNK